MACCGRICSSQCGNCHSINEGDVVLKHADHPCGKALYCGHACSGICTPDHNCADFPCKAQCQQKCSHHACDQPCTSPCAPCMEPCDWECKHQDQCPVVCGAVSTRFDYIQAFLKLNTCFDSHVQGCPATYAVTNTSNVAIAVRQVSGNASTIVCTSRLTLIYLVCGEPCNVQICPLCADEDTQNQVVDVTEGRQLFEIDPDGEELDSLLITLSCGHVFTVETLDDICDLEKYYTHEDGYWASIAPPPSGLQRPPTCPHCREPIKSPRYGRVFKRADLDMSEQVWSSSSCSSLCIHVAPLECRYNLPARASPDPRQGPQVQHHQSHKRSGKGSRQPPFRSAASRWCGTRDRIGDAREKGNSSFGTPSYSIQKIQEKFQGIAKAAQTYCGRLDERCPSSSWLLRRSFSSSVDEVVACPDVRSCGCDLIQTVPVRARLLGRTAGSRYPGGYGPRIRQETLWPSSLSESRCSIPRGSMLANFQYSLPHGISRSEGGGYSCQVTSR